MCGIAGEVRFDGSNADPSTTKAMCDLQLHRGPDDEGYYQQGPVALGIRRLSIIDLTKGLYPISNEAGTIHLIFNGEIYGFQQLREKLEAEGHRFRSATDAETVVHAYEEWGTQCLDRLNGMFAFALWDEAKRLLWIARDPFGIKPLYYFKCEKFLAFASEIKPLLGHLGVRSSPNERVVCTYLKSGLVELGDETFFTGINRLAPGHQMSVRPDGTVQIGKYWSAAVSRRVDGSVSEDEVSHTRNLFLKAIEEEVVSDAPLGTCLSGGIDSSSILCAIGQIHPKGTASMGARPKTFSAIFPGEPFNEASYAQKVCEITGAQYNPLTPTADELWNDLPTLVKCQEEPFFSMSIYAQWRVMKKAKESGITVLLDGQGGDELLAGYHPYYEYYLMNLLRARKYLAFAREFVHSLYIIIPRLKLYLKSALAKTAFWRANDFSEILTETVVDQAAATDSTVPPRDDLARRLEFDVAVFKLPALLRYEDKNSMWHSIEARVPYLHRTLYEYVASLPLDRKLRNGLTKFVFRLAMRDILPEEIRRRRDKIGFEPPEKKWMDALRPSLIEFFSNSSLHALKYYNADRVLKLLHRPTLTIEELHLIWWILNLELWYTEFFE